MEPRLYTYDVFPTNLGWVGVLASARGLRKLSLPMSSPHTALEALEPELSAAEPRPEAFASLGLVEGTNPQSVKPRCRLYVDYFSGFLT